MPEIQCRRSRPPTACAFRCPTASDLDEAGFIEQAKSIAVGIDAVVERAITEGQRTIVEGVHIVPGFLNRSHWDDAVAVEVVLAIRDPERHRSHFYVREWETDGIRPLTRYVENFAKIRRIQDYILAQAAQAGRAGHRKQQHRRAVKASGQVLDAWAGCRSRQRHCRCGERAGRRIRRPHRAPTVFAVRPIDAGVPSSRAGASATPLTSPMPWVEI